MPKNYCKSHQPAIEPSPTLMLAKSPTHHVTVCYLPHRCARLCFPQLVWSGHSCPLPLPLFLPLVLTSGFRPNRLHFVLVGGQRFTAAMGSFFSEEL